MDDFRSGQYLGFRVGRQEFALEAGSVRGILPAHELVSGDRTGADWLAGEASLRGKAFPVIDLRVKLNLRHGITGRTPSIVVAGIVTGDGNLLGILVDSVSEVIHVRAHDFRNGKIRIGRPRQVVNLSELSL